MAEPGTGPGTGADKEYLVFYADGRARAALAAVEQAGGHVVTTDTKLGYVLAKGGGDAFVDALGSDQSVVGVTTDREIGFAPTLASSAQSAAGVGASGARSAAGASADRTMTGAGALASGVRGSLVPRAFPDASAMRGVAGEPLAGRQWDMKMIGADRANKKAPGTKKVLVGVIDTGIDGKHPDIAPNFNRALSRNFVTDKPNDENGDTLDGPCEAASCKDPVDEDDEGHGTHVASTIGSPLNHIGIAGVAPGVQLVNIRAGQDSGFFFLKPSLDALTYAADIGVDVVNMSYYVDPWLFNCPRNKADSKKQQLQQRAIITGMQRALDYARKKGVTLDLRARQRLHRPGQAQGRHEQPRLPARRARRPARSTTPASTCPLSPRASSRSPRSARPAARPLQRLRDRAEQPGRARRRRDGRQGPSSHQVGPGRRPRVRAPPYGDARQVGQAEELRGRPCLHRRRPAPTTSTSTAPPWPPRTRPVSPRS